MGTVPSKADEAMQANTVPVDANPHVETKHVPAKPIHKNVESAYELLEELGSGAFSTVYRGVKKDGKDKESVAIKRVSNQACKSEDDIQGLFDEVSILQKIHHPHVMRLDSFYEDAKFYSLVTELVVGGELFDRIVQKNHYNELVARDLVRIFLETLDFLHTNGIVHRDLKPENLLLASKDDDTNVKIADFGFAKHVSEKLNTVCGTPDYIAPEICSLLDLKNTPKDKRPCYDCKCDIWSAGVIIYILLGGYPPFFDESRQRLFKKIKAGKFEFHPQYWAGTSDEAKFLISKMLTVDPRKRPSAKQLLTYPWLHKDDQDLKKIDLSGTKDELRRFNASRQFRSAVDAILIAQRLSVAKSP